MKTSIWRHLTIWIAPSQPPDRIKITGVSQASATPRSMPRKSHSGMRNHDSHVEDNYQPTFRLQRPSRSTSSKSSSRKLQRKQGRMRSLSSTSMDRCTTRHSERSQTTSTSMTCQCWTKFKIHARFLRLSSCLNSISQISFSRQPSSTFRRSCSFGLKITAFSP